MSTQLLRLTVPLSPGESPASYASRLAQRNFVRSARDFCRDMGFTFQDVVDGSPGALRTIAALGGSAFADVQAWAIVREVNGYRLRGERLVRSALRRDRLHICPECLATDASGQTLAPYGRSIWLVSAIRTCSIHDSALVEVAGQCGPRIVHDFALLIRPALAKLDDLRQSALRRRPSGLESYLENRLLGASELTPWLDGLEFHVAARVCELIGAVLLYGREASLNSLSPDDWQAAGAAGYNIAREGELTIRAFLRELETSYPSRKTPTQGPQAYYGRLYQALAFGAEDASYDPVRDLISQHVLETMPVGPGDDIFGVPVERRRLHSIRTASLETGAHPKRLRKILAGAGLLLPDHHSLSDHRVTFSAEASRELLNQLTDAIPLKGVEAYLNCGRVQARLLIDQGFIKPFVASNGADLGWHAFAKRELDDFLASLLEKACDVGTTGELVCDIPSASKRANCGAGDVLRLLLDRKLKFVGRRRGVNGYLAVLVDAAEVRELVRGAEIDGLPAYKIRAFLGTTDRVVKALMVNGHLKAELVVNPVNRCPTQIVMRKDLEIFQRSFVALVELAREWKEGLPNVREKLERRGVEPAFDPAVIHATFYRRTDIKA